MQLCLQHQNICLRKMVINSCTLPIGRGYTVFAKLWNLLVLRGMGQRFEGGTALFMCMNGTIRPHYTNAF